MTDRKRVLVVEEAKATRDMLSILLASRGHHITQASGGMEALKIAQTRTPDLVVLGADLSGVSGYDVYRILKIQSGSTRLPILLLVDFSDPIHSPTATLPGPECMLSKPFTSHEFLQRVDFLLTDPPGPAENAFTELSSARKLNPW
jgi:DNA-binding response OmpR family regulator